MLMRGTRIERLSPNLVRAVESPRDATLLRRMLDVLDIGVVALSADLREVLEKNATATCFLDLVDLETILNAARAYVRTREETGKPPPALRIEQEERGFYVRVFRSGDDPPLEILILREEILRDPDVFRLLNSRHGVTRREYQVLAALRLGKTNRQIAGELGLAEGTIIQHVHRLLERFGAPNRTRLVNMIDQIIEKR